LGLSWQKLPVGGLVGKTEAVAELAALGLSWQKLPVGGLVGKTEAVAELPALGLSWQKLPVGGLVGKTEAVAPRSGDVEAIGGAQMWIDADWRRTLFGLASFAWGCIFCQIHSWSL
jgi:hypothetical protein